MFGAGRGLLRRFDAVLKVAAGGFPAREPAFRFQDQFVVGPGLPLQFGPLDVDLRASPLGPTRGVEPAELLPEPAFHGRQLFHTGVGKVVRQLGAGTLAGRTRRSVGPFRFVTQLQCGGDAICFAGTFEPGLVPVAVGATGFEFGGAAPRLLVPLLKPGEFARGVELAAGCRLTALGRGQDGLSDVEPFPGAAAGDRGPLQNAVGQSRFAGSGVRQGQLMRPPVLRPGRSAGRSRESVRRRP